MRPVHRSLMLVLAAVLVAPLSLTAQDGQTRPLSLEDYGDWSRINQVALSPDGRWMAYAHDPNDGDATFFVKALDGDAVYEATNGQGSGFSSDGRWVAFLTSPPEEEADKLREQKKPVPKTMHLIDLSSGDRTEEVGVRSFSFSEDGRFLAAHKARSDSDAEHQGSDLLLHDLDQGTMLNLGNVSEFSFNEAGSHMAYLVDAAGKSGNGAYLVSPADGRIRPLNTGAYTYEDLTWNENGDALTALRGEKPEEKTQRANVLLVTTGIGTGAPTTSTYDPGDDDRFPDGFVLSELANTRWTEDGARIVVGIKEQEDEWEAEDDAANVDVWHWSDEQLQSRQMVTASGDRRYTYTSVYNVDSGRFMRLATDDMRRVDITDDGRMGIGRNDAEYRDDFTVQGGRVDFVRIDLASGSRATVATQVRRPLGTSPDGEWFVFAREEVVYATNLGTIETTNITEETGVDFINREFDLVAERPAYGVAGWTEDGSVLLNTRYDVWQVPLAGGDATNLTGGMGARDDIRFRIQRLDADADWTNPDGALLSAYGEWTKKSGYFRMRPGQDPQELLYADEMLGQLRKAEDADRVVFTRQTFEVFPDYWTSDLDIDDLERVTDANPQISDFAWGRRVLIDYTDQRGHHLQATLALPADYQEGEQYPMVVYFYEKMSQRHHQFSMPVYDDRPHMSTYASNGYLVLMPDIIYDDGLPGSSALDDVTAATQEVIDQGYADPDRIGLQGHSWGGYESSFIVTQTDMFAAVVTGAPLTNLMSMYNINYKRSGMGNGPILEWSQGRLGVTPWEDFDLFVSQSPIHHTPNISTPFMILHGTDDGAVDWNQGLEFFNAARRLGKEVILLSYPGEPHHLTKEANQKDFQTRMRQYFDHFLMGEPAPPWMTEGVPFLRKGREAEGPRVIS